MASKAHSEPEAVHAAVAGRPVRLGKQALKKDPRTLKFAAYLLDPKTGKKLTPAKLPPLKASVERSHLIPSWGMMGNDQFGDCTCAAAGHAIQITSATISNGAKIKTPTDAQILSAYWGTGDPANQPCGPHGPTDTGRVELDVLNFWRNTGVGGSKISAFAALTGKGATFAKEVKYTIDLFGFCYIGLALPRSAQGQAQWKVSRGASAVKGSWGGHAVILVDYDKVGPSCVTWGEVVKMSWGFLDRYCDEAYCVLTPEWLKTNGPLDTSGGISPDGFNVPSLMDDLSSITK